MAGKRIPELDALLGAAVAADDFFVIYDSSTGVTKKILKSELSTLFATDIPAATILTKLLTVDGAGSLLDADLLDGNQAAAFALLAGAAFTGNISVAGTTTLTGLTTAGKVVATELQSRVTLQTKTGSSTLTTADRNQQLFANNNLTIPNSTFTAGDWIVLNATADARFSRGAGLTMYFDGTNVAEVWVRPYRSAVAIFDSATVCRIIGGTTSAPP
jgi:hypothetical protein